jgi:hypothetical protein
MTAEFPAPAGAHDLFGHSPLILFRDNISCPSRQVRRPTKEK